MNDERPGSRRAAPEAGSRRRMVVPQERTIASTTLLAFAIPALTVGALALVQPSTTVAQDRPPTSSSLTRATVVCPPALPGTELVGTTVADPSVSGALRLRHDDNREVGLEGGGVAEIEEPGAAVVVGEEDLAPGLVAGRSGRGAATSCDPPVAETWFTGVGAGAEHTSLLQLVNPDGGPAVADVTVFGPDGPVEVPTLRGVTVRGQRTTTFDLADVVPQREELSLRVQVPRGRLGVSVVDRVAELGRGARSADWLAGQQRPRATSYLLGLGGKSGDRLLAVANPGQDEALVSVLVVTGRSEFAPSGLEPLAVPPGATRVLDLTRLLGDRSARGAVGLRIEADADVTASLRTLAGGDLSHAVAVDAVASRAGAVLGAGPKRLVVAGAAAVTDVTVVLRDGAGEQLESDQVTVDPGVGLRLPLPAAARYVELQVGDVPVQAVVESGPPGLGVVPLRELVLDSPVADVRPALY